MIPDLSRHELDENFRNSFEIFNFAKEFVPNNARAHDEDLLRKLVRDSAEKPYVYVNETLDQTKVMINKILDSNRGANIGILLPNVLLLDTYYNAIKIEHECSIYYNALNETQKLKTEQDLQNILVTTLKSAKGMEFDIVIMLGFEQTRNVKVNQYFVGATRAKSKLFLLAINSFPEILNEFDKSTYTLEYAQ